MKTHKRPSTHTRRVRTKKGRVKVRVNPYIKKRRSAHPQTGKFKANKEIEDLLFSQTKRRSAAKTNDEILGELITQLKQKSRAKVGNVGTLRLKKVSAKKGGKKIMMFGKEVITKDKPASTKIKFRPSKKLKGAF